MFFPFHFFPQGFHPIRQRVTYIRDGFLTNYFVTEQSVMNTRIYQVTTERKNENIDDIHDDKN